MQVALTQLDVERLSRDRSSNARAGTARKVAGLYAQAPLTAAERRISEDIIAAFTEDLEVAVREALSQQLRQCPYLPRPLALTLARDVESVAIPMLQYSEVLRDEDLVEIVRRCGLSKQLAVARRRRVSAQVSDALVARGREEVALTLLANGGAAISEPGLHKIIDDFGGRPALHGPMVRRTSLPPSVVERLAVVVSDEYQRYLVKQHKLPLELASPIVRQARESVVVQHLAGSMNFPGDGTQLARHMWEENRLTPTMLLRALCEGQIRFFEDGLAMMAKVPSRNVATLLRDAGPFGLKALYRRAGLPPKMYRAFRAAVNVAIRKEQSEGPASRDERLRRIRESLVSGYDEVGPEELETTLYRLSK